jgi:hypothetical protein
MDEDFIKALRFLIPAGLIAWALIVLTVLGILSMSKAHADELDTRRPTPATEWVFDAALAADMLTTLDIKDHPKIQEENPILGPRPSDGKVLAYFAAGAALHWMLTRELLNGNVPQPLITAWELTSIGVEAGFAGHNYSIGLRAKF